MFKLIIMANFFSIDGFFKDDKSEFSGFIVCDMDDSIGDKPNEHGLTDDDIFYYGLSEDEIKQAITDCGDDALEFVITSYSPYN